MIIKPKEGREQSDSTGKVWSELDDQAEYRVLGIEYGDYRIQVTDEMPSLYPARLFEVVDSAVDRNWHVEVDEEGEVHVGFKEAMVRGFWEDVHDGKPDAIRILDRIIGDR